MLIEIFLFKYHTQTSDTMMGHFSLQNSHSRFSLNKKENFSEMKLSTNQLDDTRIYSSLKTVGLKTWVYNVNVFFLPKARVGGNAKKDFWG